MTKTWNAYFNASASHINNQADYGEGATVDVQTFTYSIYQQHTFDLPNKFKAELSGYYSEPGVWGGVFLYDPNWSLNIGLQRRFFQDQLSMRISASDLFYQTGWSGVSEFDGLLSEGNGNWDSRRVSLSLSYNFRLVQRAIKRLRSANFILSYVKKPRHPPQADAYVFCLVQNKICFALARS